MVAGPGHRRQRQPAGVVGHPQVHQGDARQPLPRPESAGTVDPGRSRRTTVHGTSGELPFRWTPKHFDVTWKIEVYKNDDTTLSIGQPGRFRPRRSRPRSSRLRRWRRPPCPTAGGSSATTPPARRTAAAGRTSAGSTSTRSPCRWSPEQRFAPAAERRRADLGAVLGRRAAGRGYSSRHPQQQPHCGLGLLDRRERLGADVSFPDGTYTWTVTAYDASGNAMGISQTRTFVVNRRSPQLRASRSRHRGTEVGKTFTSTHRRGASPASQHLPVAAQRLHDRRRTTPVVRHDHGRPGQDHHAAGDGQLRVHRRRQRVERHHCHVGAAPCPRACRPSPACRRPGRR